MAYLVEIVVEREANYKKKPRCYAVLLGSPNGIRRNWASCRLVRLDPAPSVLSVNLEGAVHQTPLVQSIGLGCVPSRCRGAPLIAKPSPLGAKVRRPHRKYLGARRGGSKKPCGGLIEVWERARHAWRIPTRMNVRLTLSDEHGRAHYFLEADAPRLSGSRSAFGAALLISTLTPPVWTCQGLDRLGQAAAAAIALSPRLKG